MFVNMDKTAVFFEAEQKRTVHYEGENTISIKIIGRNSRRMPVCVAVLSNAAKLPLFLIFIGQPGGCIELSLPSILPQNTFGFCQAKS